MAIKAIPVYAGYVAPEGSRTFQVEFDFSLGPDQLYQANLADIGMSMVQGVYINNSNNASSVAVAIGGAQQVLTLGPSQQGFFPALMPGLNISLAASSAGLVTVPVLLLNFPVTVAIWSSSPIVTGSVTVSGSITSIPYTGAWTQRSAALTTGGVSQTLMAANAARKSFFVQNPATIAGQNVPTLESVFVDYNGAAGVDNGSSVEILPGGAISVGPLCTTQAITFVAATTGHRVIAREMN